MRPTLFFAGILLAAIFGYLAFRNVDVHQLRTELLDINPLWLAFGLGAFSLGYLARTVRWQLVLKSGSGRHNLPLPACAGPYIASLALNNILPFRVGDIARIAFARTELEIPPSVTFAALVIERALDVLVLSAFFGLGLVWWGASYATVLGYAALSMSGALVSFLVIIVLAGPAVITFIDGRIVVRTVADGLPHRATQFLKGTLEAFAVTRRISLLLQLAALSIVTWSFEGTLFWSLERGTALDFPGASSWFAMAAANLSTMLPGAPGHFGTFHYFFTVSMTGVGVGKSDAVAQALLAHALIWLTVTVTGLGLAIHIVGMDVFRPSKLRLRLPQ